MMRLLDYITQALNDMPPSWGHLVNVLYLLLPPLIAFLVWHWYSRRKQLRDKLSVLASYTLEEYLSKDAPRESVGLSANPLVSAQLHWADWADRDGTARGYLVEHSRQSEVRKALLETDEAEGASMRAIVGRSATGKTVLALGIGRAFRSAGRPREVYVVRTPDAAADSRQWRDDLADACELAGIERRPKPLVILEDIHLDWVGARQFMLDCKSDQRLAELHILATCRPLPSVVEEPSLEPWYDALPKHEVGSKQDYLDVTESIARQVCEYSATRDSMATLEWARVSDSLDEWRAITEGSLLEWVVLLASVTAEGEDVEVDRGLLLDHVLKGLALPSTSLYPSIQELRRAHNHEPHVALALVARLSAPRGISVPARFIEDVVGTPRPMIEALISAGLLVDTNVEGETYLLLPHQGIAKLIAEAMEARPDARSIENDIRTCLASAQVPDASTLSHVVWSAYLHWIGATGQIHAFGDLCANISLGYQRQPNVRLVPGVVNVIRFEGVVGPLTNEDRTSYPQGGDGVPTPLGRVKYMALGTFGPATASLQTSLDWIGPRLGDMLFAVYSSMQGQQRAGAALLLTRAGIGQILPPLTHDLVNNGSDGVRFAAAWALGFARHRAGIAALGHALKADSSRIVRATSAWALGEIGVEDETAVEALLDGLRDEDGWVVAECVWSSGVLKCVRALPRLLIVWVKWSGRSDPGHAAMTVSENLLNELSEEALHEMVEMEDEEVALSAYCLLLQKGHTEAADLIAEYINSDNAVLQKAAIAAIALDDDIPVAVNDIVTALYDGDVDTRLLAMRAAARRRLDEAVPSARTLLSDDDATVRYQAAEYLGYCGTVEDAELLQPLLDDRDTDLLRRAVSKAAEAALRRIRARSQTGGQNSS